MCLKGLLIALILNLIARHIKHQATEYNLPLKEIAHLVKKTPSMADFVMSF